MRSTCVLCISNGVGRCCPSYIRAIPLDIVAQEQQELQVAKRGHPNTEREVYKNAARQRGMAQWQARWDAVSNGRWTHRLIPKLEAWLNRKHGEVDYYLTQIISGHGCFKCYLHRFGHEEDPFCDFCDPETEEDVEHVLFACPRFSDHRRRLKEVLGLDVAPENLVLRMIESEEAWEAVCGVSADIIQQLRVSEQLRRRNEREQRLETETS